MRRKIKLADLKKVEATTVGPLSRTAGEVVQAIIKVKNDDYVPECVQLRAAISPQIFTAEFKHADLEKLEKDAQVESVSIKKKLRLQE